VFVVWSKYRLTIGHGVFLVFGKLFAPANLRKEMVTSLAQQSALDKNHP